MNTIEYLLRFDAPFIVGSGLAIPGLYDRMSTVSDGVPYVPPSSIRGRVRAAVLSHCIRNSNGWQSYQICSGHAGTTELYCVPDEMKRDYGICAVCRIFGSPGGEVRAGYEFSAARAPAALVDLLRELHKAAPEGGLFHRHARNRRDYLLRKTREDAFFAFGLVNPVIQLEGKVIESPTHLAYDQPTQHFDRGLLLLGMWLVRELGGGRNRGYGRCRFVPREDLSSWEEPIRAHVEAWKNGKNRRDGEV